MIEKMVGEVDRRSYKDGSRAQLTLVIRDKGVTKPSFKKLRENLSFFTFYQGHCFFLTETVRRQGKITPSSKGEGGATAYCQCITGGAEEATTFLLKGRCGVLFSYTDLMSEPMF